MSLSALPSAIENIITDYKNQLELTEKFSRCIVPEINKIKYRIYSIGAQGYRSARSGPNYAKGALYDTNFVNSRSWAYNPRFLTPQPILELHGNNLRDVEEQMRNGLIF